jgi:hypothetical protein
MGENVRHLLIVALVFVAACEKKSELSNTTPSPSQVVAEPAMAAKDLLEAVATPSATKVLKAPLPGDVKLDFPHNIVMETSREVAGVQMRTLMIEPKVPVKDAVASLSQAFEASGFKPGPPSAHTVGFSKGGTGEGMMAVASGGTHVALTFNDFRPDNPRVKEGFTGMINMTINSGPKK